MTGLPYDDINQWRSIYPLDIFENQLRLVAEGFKEGIDELKASVTDKDLAENKRLAEFVDVATGTYCLFKSSYQQTAYNVTRNKFDEETDSAKKEEYRKRIIELLNAEMDTAMEMYKVMIHNSTIGYASGKPLFLQQVQHDGKNPLLRISSRKIRQIMPHFGKRRKFRRFPVFLEYFNSPLNIFK